VIFRGGRIGNELIFEIPMCGLVSSLGPETKVRFETSFNEGATQDGDVMPD
jgi:hypothetical protein